MRVRKTTDNDIKIYCMCQHCNTFFDVTGKKRSLYCNSNCRSKHYYNKNKERKG